MRARWLDAPSTRGLGRAPLLGLALSAVCAGWLSKQYEGPGSVLVVGHAWDVLGSAAVYLLARAALPRLGTSILSVTVLAVLFANELLQLLEHPWLASLRETRPGAVVLGSSFDPLDLLAIAAGVIGATCLVDAIGAQAGGGTAPSQPADDKTRI